MKAKDYVTMYREEQAKGVSNIDALIPVLNGFTREFGELTDKRGTGSESAALGCFREMEQKYHAFARLASTEEARVLPDGWRYFLQEMHPQVWGLIRVMQMREAG